MKILEDPPLNVERKCPWIIDIFLYPFSAAGAIHLVVFCLAPPFLGLSNRLVFAGMPFGSLIVVWVLLLVVAYMVYYLSFCIFDSSKGGLRAPDINVGANFDRQEILSHLMLILGSVAICFWPISVYYLFARRIDVIFWLLAGGGLFLFPMALLAGVLFDATHALNPIFLVCSIFKSPLPYCGLLVFYAALAGLIAAVFFDLSRLLKPQDLQGAIMDVFRILNYFFSRSFWFKFAMSSYLAMVASHVLGSFYWLNKYKLNWGI